MDKEKIIQQILIMALDYIKVEPDMSYNMNAVGKELLSILSGEKYIKVGE